jgi:hypothetical protein
MKLNTHLHLVPTLRMSGALRSLLKTFMANVETAVPIIVVVVVVVVAGASSRAV